MYILEKTQAYHPGTNLTGTNFLQRKEKILAALDHEIRHGDLDMMAAIRRTKRTL